MNNQPNQVNNKTFTWLLVGIGGLAILIFTALVVRSVDFSSVFRQGPGLSGVAMPKDGQIIIPAVTARDHRRGATDPTIVLVEYGDFECPFCKMYHPTVQGILAAFPSDVQHVYRHFPLSFHEHAFVKGVASECAGKLGGQRAFWEYHDMLFDRANDRGQGVALDDLPEFAAELGIERQAFIECLDDPTMAQRVETDFISGQVAGITGTPATVILLPDGTARLEGGVLGYEELHEFISGYIGEE